MHSLTPPETRRPSQILTTVRAPFIDAVIHSSVLAVLCRLSKVLHTDCICSYCTRRWRSRGLVAQADESGRCNTRRLQNIATWSKRCASQSSCSRAVEYGAHILVLLVLLQRRPFWTQPPHRSSGSPSGSTTRTSTVSATSSATAASACSSTTRLDSCWPRTESALLWFCSTCLHSHC